MKLLKLFLLFFSFNSYTQVVINEIDPDTPSTDVKEFIELHSSIPNYSLNGFVLVFFNGTTAGTGNSSYFAIDLDGYTTDVNGNFLIGNSQVSPAPIIDLPETTLQNGPDAIALYIGNASDFPLNTIASTTNLIHAIAYSNSTTAPTVLMTALGLTSFVNENSTSNAANHSIQRKNDGTFEVKLPTPGMNNDGSGIVLNYLTTSVNLTTINEGQNLIITFNTTQNVTSDLTINFSLINGSFTTSDYLGSLSATIINGTNSITSNISILNDGLNDGDEELKISLNTLPVEYVKNNDNLILRVVDQNFLTASYGTPLNPTYGNVISSAPNGYYSSLNGLSGSNLKQALQDIIANPTVVRAHNYGDIYDILRTADVNPANNNQVWLMYVEQGRSKLDQQTDNSIIGKWNREHIYCQSRGGFQDGTSSTADGINVWLPTNANDILAGHADAHHIRAEDGQENSSRNNRNYGVDYNGPTGTQGSWKGDVARALFYMAVRYNGLNVVNGNVAETPSGFIGDLTTLLQWHNQDPPDDFEMHRNNYIYTWQFNRNPFIDYPQLVNYIFGNQTNDVWDSNLSVEELNSSLELLLFPNPTSNEINISSKFQIEKIEIFNLLGQLMVSKPVNNNFINLKIDFPTGIYDVKILVNQRIIDKKIVVK